MIPTAVLDTNAWLDWLVFDDPCVAPLRAAHANGRLAIASARDCRAELAVVLARPIFGLGADGVASALAEHDRVAALHEGERAASPLVCRDPDDQKFLEVALAIGAALLVTKDRALLKLASRARRAARLEIVRPQELARRAPWLVAGEAASDQAASDQAASDQAASDRATADAAPNVPPKALL